MKYIDDITNFIFLEDKPEKSDIIFVPGNGFPASAERAAMLWKEGFAPLVLPSGKHSITDPDFKGPADTRGRYTMHYETEWEFLHDVLIQNGVNAQSILKENQATFTYENAIFSRRSTDAAGITVKTAIVCCQPYHARRCFMYYETCFPETKLLLCPAEPTCVNITRNNWFQTDPGIDMVLGELNRCGTQFGYMLKERAAASLLPINDMLIHL